MTGGSRDDAIALTEVSSRQTLISSAIVAVGMYIVFPWLIRLAYGHRYEGAVWPFFVLLPGLVCKAASNIVIQYATNSLGQPITSIWMNGVSALLNAALCVVLLPTWGVMGGAVASTASYVISFYLYGLWFAHVTGHPASALWRVTRADITAYRRLLAALWRPIRSRLSKRA
jgi:O-antigen/teichoic acid export membrane protein